MLTPLQSCKKENGSGKSFLNIAFEWVCCIAVYQKSDFPHSRFLFFLEVQSMRIYLLQLSTVLKCKGLLKKFTKREAERHKTFTGLPFY